MILTDPALVRDEGTVVVMSGTEESTGRRFEFAVDHRNAQQIVDLEPEAVELEAWQLLGPA